MIETPICAHCGHVVCGDDIERGDLRIEASGTVIWRDEPVRLTHAQRTVLRIVASSPTPLTRAELAQRTGYHGDDPVNLINVLIHNIRKRMPGVPIATIHRQGVAWG